MSGIAQIIAALMSVRPTVDQVSMGAGGGGGGGGISLGGSTNVGMQTPQRRQRQPYQMQDIPVEMTPQTGPDPMQQVQPPGYQGSPLQGPPDPAQAYQPGQTPVDPVAQLERSWYENEAEIARYSNPKNVRDAWESREKLPGLQQQSAALQQQMRQYNAEQEQRAQDARYMRAMEMVSDMPGMSPQDKDALARQAAMDERMFQNLATAFTERGATLDQRKFDQGEEFRQEVDTKQALGRITDMDELTAEYLANTGRPLETLVDLWRTDQDRIAEEAQLWQQEQMKVRDEVLKADQAINTTRTAISDVGPFTAGAGSLLKILPGTPQANLDKALDTLRAMTAFKALYDMRQASPTGGALGNVSNREIELLYSSWVALQQEQSPDRLRDNLNTLLERYQRVKFLIEAESEGKLKGITGVEQAKMADDFVNKTHMDSFQQNVPNADNWLRALQAGDITTQEFEQEFGFSPILDTMQ